MFSRILCTVLLTGLTCTRASSKCTREKWETGLTECADVDSPYAKYQWATCASNQSRNQNPLYRTKSSDSYKLITCMDVTDGDPRKVSETCKCDIRSSESANAIAIDQRCYIRPTGDCSWYENCLEKHNSCKGTYTQIVSFIGKTFCSLRDKDDSLSKTGRLYLQQVGQCIQRTSFPIFLPGNEALCSNRTKILKELFTNCCENTSVSFCRLDVKDQMRLFWPIKMKFWNSNYSHAEFFVDLLRTCLKHSSTETVKQFTLTIFNTISNVSYFIEKFAARVGWESKGMLWETKVAGRTSSTTDLSVILTAVSQNDTSESVLVKELKQIANKISRHEFDDLKVIKITPDEDTSTSSPFTRPRPKKLIQLPLKNIQMDRGESKMQEDVGIRFHFYSRSAPRGDGVLLDPKSWQTVWQSSYSGAKSTAFVIHGIGSYTAQWVQSLKSALLGKADMNVVVVDWGNNDPNIQQDPSTLNSVAYMTNVIITMLRIYKYANLEDMHVIGHGEGAHIAGNVGDYERGQIGRITGLDPSRKKYKDQCTTNRLDAGDAQFVDVIHSDVTGVGMSLISGDVDYFPNGGMVQPGCAKFSWRNPLCNHERAAALFIESIESDCEFVACRCSLVEYIGRLCHRNTCKTDESCTRFGYHADHTARGLFYLDTYFRAPYCTNKCPGDFQRTIFETMRPDSPEDAAPYFYLFTQENMYGVGQSLNFSELGTIQSSNYNGQKKTVFLIHGFRHSSREKWMQSVMNGILRKEDVNVILVDWERGSYEKFKDYFKAAVNTILVGNHTCLMIKCLTQYFNADMLNIHMIGHSLGSHASGFAGTFCGSKIGRITGLDPAGIGFYIDDSRFRLDPSDAVFVDAIHTDTNGVYGLTSTLGHVDFYPNIIGEIQPGCGDTRCSHWRSYMYFIESLLSTCQFKACNCSQQEFMDKRCNPTLGSGNLTCTVMGYDINTEIRGTFYLDTDDHFPFCTGQFPGEAEE